MVGQRVTPVGKWMRQSSIDELPQLRNDLADDMSLDVQILLRTVPVVLTARGAHCLGFRKRNPSMQGRCACEAVMTP